MHPQEGPRSRSTSARTSPCRTCTCWTTRRPSGAANSETTALSSPKFLIDERDGNFDPFAQKTLCVLDTNGATDVSNLKIDGKSPEAFVGAVGTNAALAALTGTGVQVAQKQPYLDVGMLASRLDPTGKFIAHDKVEGVATIHVR
jgi:hypothetical protein